jgi:hypothetical protein
VPIGKEGPDGFLPYAPLDQRLDEPQGLTFTTPELTQSLPLAGPTEFRFWTVTEGSDMAYVARLIDVSPDGSTRLITQGWLRASFRYVDPARSRPGAPYLPDDRQLDVTIGLTTEYRMDIWDTAYTLAPGHRLRLWLSSSDTPTHEPLPVAGRNLILHDSDHPSQLLIGTRIPSGSGTATPLGLQPSSGNACVAGRRLTFRINPVPGGRVVRVVVFVNGHRVARRRGRSITTVSFKRPPGRRLLVKIVSTNNWGGRVVTRRTFRGCTRNRVRGRVHRRPRG